MGVEYPLRADSFWIAREEYGWSVFYLTGKAGTVLLYAKCTLQEAGNVVQEAYDSPDNSVTVATCPAHYK